MDRVVRELSKESDASLFRMMAACGEKASEQGQAALQEIYQRYCAPLFRRCGRFSKALGGDSGVRDLVQDTFIRAYERAGTHQSHAELGPTREARKTLRWLNRIGTRLFLDLRAKQIKERAARSKEWYDLVSEESRKCSTYGHEVDGCTNHKAEARRTLAHRALAGLIERDRYIVLVSLDWYDRTRKDPFRVPPDIIEGICEKYQITTDYYRQIRRRAMKQLALFLAAAA